MQITTAKKAKSFIKMALQGPSGSGKSYSALLLAKGLVGRWEDITVIDTENGSAHLYADIGSYNVLELKPPFTPEQYIEAIDTCVSTGSKAIIIDSISHEWDGIGGILDIHGSMTGNSFANWSKVTPRHNAFVQAMLQAQTHILATIRAKQDYVLSDKNGKMVPEKVGLKGITRDGMDYEFTLVFDLSINHQASVSKDRTQLFERSPATVIKEQTGERIRAWCTQESADLMALINEAKSLEELKQIYIEHPAYQRKLSQQFMRRKAELTNGISNL